MISHHHKCIFIHVPKVAGISIEQVFLDDLNLDFRNRMPLLLGENTNLDSGPPRISHLTADEYVDLKFIPRILFNEYFKFAFVRNPYDRVYSFYKYLGYRQLVSFKEFVLSHLPKIMKDEDIFYFIQPMYNYIYSENGEKLVDFVGKLENIDEDFNFVADRMSFTDVKLQHHNNSENISIKTKLKRSTRIIKKYPHSLKYLGVKKATEKCFDDEMRKIVYGIYEKDFQHFQYLA